MVKRKIHPRTWTGCCSYCRRLEEVFGRKPFFFFFLLCSAALLNPDRSILRQNRTHAPKNTATVLVVTFHKSADRPGGGTAAAGTRTAHTPDTWRACSDFSRCRIPTCICTCLIVYIPMFRY